MQVCILATSFPRWSGDYAGQFVFQLARHLALEGVNPIVVAPRGPLADGRPAPRREEWEQVEIVRFPYCFAKWERLAYGAGIPANLKAHPIRSLGLAPIFLAAFGRAIRAASSKCDLIQANWAISAMVAEAVRPRVPLVLTVRGSDVNRFPARGFMGRLVTRTARRADQVITVSDPLADRICERGVHRERVRTIRNGVDLPDCVREHTGPGRNILWVGRMVSEKCLPTLIRAFARVHSEKPEARLTLVGDGNERPAVEQVVAQESLTGSVSFEGARPFSDVSAYYANADICVLSSRSEGLPNVILEAMAHGVPVVSTDVGGVSELIEHGINGLLAPAGDADSLAHGILSLLSDATKRQRLGKASRRTVEPMSWKETARQYIRTFESAIAARA